MRNPHGMVVDHISKMVRRETVPLDYNEVVLLLWPAVAAVDKVSHLGLAGALEPHAMRFAIGGTTIRL